MYAEHIGVRARIGELRYRSGLSNAPTARSALCRYTALHLASKNGHTETVKALLKKGAAVDIETEGGCACL